MDTDNATVTNKKYIRGLKALSEILKELGLPSSPRTLRRYEQAGIIPSAKNPKGVRLYTQEQIDTIIYKIAGN